MEALAQQFTEQYQVNVKVNPGPSNGLANQILAGAPADLFLSANQQWADEIEKAGRAQSVHRLLTNRLVLAVPRGNPAGIREPQDLTAGATKKCALAGEKVPAGIYADQALGKLGLLDKLIQDRKIVRGQDVRSALSFVERGEAEAGIVYETDVTRTNGVEVVHRFDPALHDEIVYVLVLVQREPPGPDAKLFLDFVRSPQADEMITRFHFERVSSPDPN
jgi:molybdate transport system substrate-binding protein